MLYDRYTVGDRVTWQAKNSEQSGIVEEVTDRGLLVAMDNGKYMLLTTSKTLQKTRKRP